MPDDWDERDDVVAARPLSGAERVCPGAISVGWPAHGVVQLLQDIAQNPCQPKNSKTQHEPGKKLRSLCALVPVERLITLLNETHHSGLTQFGRIVEM
jgi:hypothetical protein